MSYEFLITGPKEMIAMVHSVRTDGNPVDFSFLANKCIRRTKRDFAAELTIGIGSSGTSLVECASSYKAALQCLSYRFYERRAEVLDESVLCVTPPEKAANHVDYENIIYFISSSRKDKVREFCRSYFSNLLYVPMPSPNYVRGMCGYLVTDVWKALGDKLGGERTFSQTEVLLQVNTIRTWTELKDYLTDFLVECAGRMAERESGSENRIILDAEHYIKSHMGEKILAKHVAGYVNLSDVYFTSYFKLKTGVNFRDYVIGIKMERVKELLKHSPHMSVAEVAASIGYDDYRSFYRVFKQYTGVAPSDYGQQNGGGQTC